MSALESALAELRSAAATSTLPHLTTPESAALLGEIDRLTAEREQLADFDALGARGAALQAERDQAVRRWHDEHKRAETAEGERDRLWMLLEIERGLTSSVRLHVNQLLGMLGPQRPQDAPQRDAQPPGAGSAATEPTEPSTRPQRPAESVEVWSPAYTEWCHATRTSGGGVIIWPASTEAVARGQVARLRMNPREGVHYAVLRREVGPAIEDDGPITPEDEATLTVLTVTSGPCTGLSAPLDIDPVTVGRAPSCTLAFDDEYASPCHARFERSASGAWTVQDLGSTNGTYLGRVRIVAPAPVSAGSVVRIGRTTLEVRQRAAQSPIAPEDKGISSADVTAQQAADQRAYCPDCELPETNCACG